MKGQCGSQWPGCVLAGCPCTCMYMCALAVGSRLPLSGCFFCLVSTETILRADPSSLVYGNLCSFPETRVPHLPCLSKDLLGVLCWGAGMCSPVSGEILAVSLLCLPAVCWISCFVWHKRNFESCQRWPWVYRSLCLWWEHDGQPRAAGVGIWDLLGAGHSCRDPRALCNSFLGPWSLSLCPASCLGEC